MKPKKKIIKETAWEIYTNAHMEGKVKLENRSTQIHGKGMKKRAQKESKNG